MSKNASMWEKIEGDFFGEKIKIWGATTTPLLSAECQIKKKIALKLDVSMA